MDEEVQLFYKQLDSIIAKTPKKDILVVKVTGMPKWALTLTNIGQGQ